MKSIIISGLTIASYFVMIAGGKAQSRGLPAPREASTLAKQLSNPVASLISVPFQATLELLAYLRANGFKTFIVSGGGIEFMRPWTEKMYGIPPEQVVGSSGKTKFEMRDGTPVLLKLPAIDFELEKNLRFRAVTACQFVSE